MSIWTGSECSKDMEKGDHYKRAIRYTHPAFPIQKVAARPESRLNRQGGSKFKQRQRGIVMKPGVLIRETSPEALKDNTK